MSEPAKAFRRELPDRDVLLSLLRYEPDTGRLFWKARGNPQFDGQFAGREAFTCRSRVHRQGRIFERAYLAHRIIWKMVYGTEPETLDHINGDGGDNRLCNLREVTQLENSRNSRRSRASTTGITGVSFVRRVSRWRAYITVGNVQHHLGYFTEIADAVAARKAAEVQHDFHENHGRSTMTVAIAFLPKLRSNALRKSARGQPCSLRLPGICNHRDETTVLAHLPGIGKGVGSKVSDLHAAFACSSCHDAIDRHTYEKHGLTGAIVLDAMLRGHSETMARWLLMGLLQVPDGEMTK